MAYKKVDPERRERRKKLSEFLRGVGVTDVDGVKELFKDMVGTVLENGLEGELDEELGYSNRLNSVMILVRGGHPNRFSTP